jgi:hypothetical protein
MRRSAAIAAPPSATSFSAVFFPRHPVIVTNGWQLLATATTFCERDLEQFWGCAYSRRIDVSRVPR